MGHDERPTVVLLSRHTTRYGACDVGSDGVWCVVCGVPVWLPTTKYHDGRETDRTIRSVHTVHHAICWTENGEGHTSILPNSLTAPGRGIESEIFEALGH